MGTAERRMSIIKILCRRRYETIVNLAAEFGVSERTVRWDIETLSLSEHIYTKSGRYGGSVYIVQGYYCERMYMTDAEILLLSRLFISAEQKTACNLNNNGFELLRSIILKYTKQNRRADKSKLSSAAFTNSFRNFKKSLI